MRRAARSGSERIPRAWLFPAVAAVVIVAAGLGDLLSRSVVVDLVAWWPVWLVVGVLAATTRGRRLGRVRVAGLVPLLALAVLVAVLVGHLAGWAAMPSASARLIGPPADEALEAAMSARPSGVLRVQAGNTGFLYTVEPVRWGGTVPLPAAAEQSRPGHISVALEPVADPGWYLFAGWDLRLARAPAWNLTLGGDVEADLASVTVSGLQLQGSGAVRLGTVSGPVSVSVAGDFGITVPAGQPARVVGEAQVPAGWVADADGHMSPHSGDGWVISVGEGSTLRVFES